MTCPRCGDKEIRVKSTQGNLAKCVCPRCNNAYDLNVKNDSKNDMKKNMNKAAHTIVGMYEDLYGHHHVIFRKGNLYGVGRNYNIKTESWGEGDYWFQSYDEAQEALTRRSGPLSDISEDFGIRKSKMNKWGDPPQEIRLQGVDGVVRLESDGSFHSTGYYGGTFNYSGMTVYVSIYGIFNYKISFRCGDLLQYDFAVETESFERLLRYIESEWASDIKRLIDENIGLMEG